MVFILKKLPRQHGPNEPFRHENHPRPVTRRQLLGAGFLTGPAMVLAPAWLGSLLKSSNAMALDATVQSMQPECKIQGSGGAGTGPLPFIVIDLAGGANLIGSEALVGVKGGQMNFLSAAGYSKLGLPGSMIPTSTTFIDVTMGMAFHSDSAILRGIKTRANATTLAGVNGIVIPAMSQNDTGNNPLNPMYGIAKAAQGPVGANKQFGSLLTLVGTQSSVSGGNSAPPATTSVGGSVSTLQPTKIASAADDTGLVSTSGNAPNPDTLAALAAQSRISTGATVQASAATPAQAAFANSTLAQPLIGGAGNAAADAALREQVRCAYVKTAYTADQFGSPSSLNPDLDTNIVAASGAIFTTAEYNADNDIKKTAAVMKLVLNGYAGAGTITLGGYDYHSGNRADGETKNQKAGVIIGAILDYARRVNRPVMIQVISDGSLTSTGNADTSTAGRGKLGWQGDSQQVAASLLIAYSPKGRPVMSPNVPGNQIGFVNTDGTVNATSSPAANANNLLVQTVMLNWMAANGTLADFATIFPTQGLGAQAARDALTAFTQIT